MTIARTLPFGTILALILAAVLSSGPPVWAQSTSPTVSTVAITSNPGTDGTYATGDTITVAVTFNDAVTVSTTGGTPRVTLDIAGQPRYASYTGAGSANGQILFDYTVLVGDQDDDGVKVLANSLDLNGGTIQATDDSANATLTHSAITFTTHKVDTEVLILGNGTWHDWPSDITISATQDFYHEFRLHDSREFDISKLTLNVKTPSNTLEVTVLVGEINKAMVFKFTGSVASAGFQDFTPSEDSLLWQNAWADTFYILIEGSGSGSIELEAKDYDRAGLIFNPVSDDPDFY